MKTLNTRWRLIALVPLVAVAILSIGNRIGAVPDQNKEVREAANEVGIVVQGGITHGQILRFNLTSLANVNPGPSGHPGGVNLELKVYDSNGNVLASNTFVPPNGNQNGGGIWISSFDLNADQLPASAFDNTGRAQVTGIVRLGHYPPGCGFLASGEIFSLGDVNRRTLAHIAGTPVSECREAA